MHEVVHLSFGPVANELNTQFYNAQQTYFVYRKEDLPKSHIDPNVRFVYGKEYTPRAAFWDYRNGFGQWKQYNENYEEPQPHNEIGVDQGRPTITLEGDNAASETWTSRSKVPLHPSSLHKIPDWEFDAVKFPYGHQRGAPESELRQFDTMEEGTTQFLEVCKAVGGKGEDYLDTTLRPLLEKCDLVDGVNLIVDLSGWAGFLAPYLEVLRDEYLPKQPVFTWSVSRNLPKYNWQMQKSRIEALAALAEHSSLVLPLQDSLVTSTAQDITANAQSHLPVFETLGLLSSLRRNRVQMHQICQDLTLGAPRANIVQASYNNYNSCLNEFRGPIERVGNTVHVSRGVDEPLRPDEDYSYALHNNRQYHCPQPLPQQESANFVYEVNDNPLKLRKLVSRANHEVRELVHDLTDPYIWGYNDPSDDDDVF